MLSDTALLILYKETREFLIEQIGDDILTELANHHPKTKPANIKTVFHHLINSLVATKRMRETIEIESLAEVLFQFNPKKTFRYYGDVEKLLNKIRAKHESWEIESYDRWETFCKGVLSGASLSRLDSFKAFKQFIDGFRYNEKTIAVLPLLLQKEIRGYRFPMACSFLQSIGYSDYIAPDKHVKDLLHEIWVIETWENYEVLKTIIRISRVNDVKPVVTHKLFSILGSDRITENATEPYKHRRDFVNHITPILDRFIYS